MRFIKFLNWFFGTIRLNWSNMTSNPRAFWSMAALMAIQNLIYFGLWGIVFSRVSSLRGWGLPEMAFLYGSGAVGFGILFTVFGGLNRLSQTIQNGELDLYLGRPRPVLISVLMQNMRADSLGDIAAGIALIGFFIHPELSSLPLLLVLSVSAGIAFAAFRLIMHSLTFWGLGGETSENGFIAFLIAATNPQKGFGVWGKLVLLTVIPAGYVGLLPVEILRHFDWRLLALQLGGSGALLAFSIFLFYRGLRRYTSGNQFLTQR
ncbi:MAG: ABC-2 family transporter protein [Spirochaetia bacterium]|nr:ABC-2 family transporter protein [Spirochaetia bacterium]